MNAATNVVRTPRPGPTSTTRAYETLSLSLERIKALGDQCDLATAEADLARLARHPAPQERAERIRALVDCTLERAIRPPARGSRSRSTCRTAARSARTTSRSSRRSAPSRPRGSRRRRSSR